MTATTPASTLGTPYETSQSTKNATGAEKERLLEDISFSATERPQSNLCIDAVYVDEHLEKLVQDQDLSRYIL